MSFQMSKEITKMPFYILFIIFVALVIIIGGRLYLDRDVKVGSIENNLLISRIISSEDCLASENLGEINLDHFNENQISGCTGINEESGQGVYISFNFLDNSSSYELELNKALTTKCLVDPDRNRDYCDYVKYYFVSEGKGGILEILIANVQE